MKRILLFCAMLLPLTAAGQLVVTEIMSSSAHTDATRDADWWELTNTGASAVNLQNYSWDDNSVVAGTVKFNAGITIQPGESIIILDEISAAAFKTAWGLTGTNPLTSQPYQVLIQSNFTAPTGFPGLTGTGADGVFVFNTANIQIASASYTTVSAAGRSRAWFTNGTAVAGNSARSAYTARRHPSIRLRIPRPPESPRHSRLTHRRCLSVTPARSGTSVGIWFPRPSVWRRRTRSDRR